MGSVRRERTRLERWLLYLLLFFASSRIFQRLGLPGGELSTSLPLSTSFWQKSPYSPALLSQQRGAISTTRAPFSPETLLPIRGRLADERGLLKVYLESMIHPIHQLIRDARKLWDDKLARQSQTLREAVAEYQRRYRRQPPKGFDRWWKYVVDNNVTLPDEYDQINRDLLPFRALSPEDLNRRLDDASRFHDTYTLQVRMGSLRTSVSFDENKIGGSRERLADQVALIEPVAKDLEDFTAVYSVHDEPRMLISYNHWSQLVGCLNKGGYFDENGDIDLTVRGWPAMCPAESRMGAEVRGTTDNIDFPNGTRESFTFIADHRRSMDLCDHPEVVPLHGTLAGKNPQVAPLTPLFVLSKTTLHADILGVPVDQLVRGVREVPWEEKLEDRMLWRGRNTGTYYSKETPWRQTQRPRLVKLVNGDEGEVEILSSLDGVDQKTVGKGRRTVPRKLANDYYFDMAFAGEPIQCDASDGTCKEVADEHRYTEIMTHDAALYYKYVIDVDGNAWAARFQRLLSGGSLIFKATIFPEWWTDRMQAWVHYVPIQLDYSDLYNSIAFFRGDTSGLGGEPTLAREIAEAGKAWANENWRQVDMTAYAFRLYLEWARLLAPHRDHMDFVYEEKKT